MIKPLSITPVTPAITPAMSKRIRLPGIDLSSPAIISLIGAGGKTTALFRLSQQLKEQGHAVLITTSTRMYLPTAQHYQRLVMVADQQHLLQQLTTCPVTPGITYCCHAHDPQNNKVDGIDRQLIDHIKQHGPFSVILVEADGAHQLPLKAPANHEPQIPNTSDWVIAVTGGEMINVAANPRQIHRWPLFTQRLGIQADEKLDAGLFSRWVNHPQGLFQQVPQQAGRSWLINKIPHNAQAPLIPFVHQVLENCPHLNAIWLAAMQQSGVIRCFSQNLQSNRTTDNNVFKNNKIRDCL